MSSVKDLLRGDVVDGSGTANYVSKWSDADTITNSVIYESSGNIGIGTNSPVNKLDVVGNINVNDTSFFRYNGDTGLIGSGTGISGGTSTQLGIRAANDILFATGGATERMRIDSSGRVGVGTQSPQGVLNIVRAASGATRSATAQELVLEHPFNVGMSLLGEDARIAFGDAADPEAGVIQYVHPSDYMSFKTASAERMRIDASGNVIIQQGQIQYPNAGDFLLNASNAAGEIQFRVAGGERMRITSGGNVLIGTTSYLGAAGNARFQLVQSNPNWVHYIQNSAASGAVYCSALNIGNQAPNNTISAFIAGGDSSAERFRIYSNGGLANYQANNVNLSDERVKTDINPLGSYWDKFKALELVTFKYKDQSHNDDNIGLIAQQVESVAPEFVSNEGFGETPEGEEPLKTIYTADLYHATIKVLQEAMTKIENLEAEIELLKSQK
jgi:hypothetical protein